MASATELAAMQRAVELSTDALGSTNPNPCVGAVVLDASGQVLGEGVTQPVGGDHAEVGALRAAGARARGATIVVTLEPCTHTGRTRPCTDAIIAAGIARVVYALDDPHPAAAGGAQRLREAGLEVETGVLTDAAAQVLGAWLFAVGHGRPHVTWKYAATLDGRTAAVDGTSRWITGDEARIDVHRERARVDAVIVGIGTVLIDDPALTVRDWPTTRQPLRVVVDSAARTPTTAAVLDSAAPTLVAVGADAGDEQVAALQARGADVARLARPDGRVDLVALLAALYERDVCITLLEGGSTLAASFVRERLVDRVLGYHAPVLLGAGAPLLGDVGVSTIAEARRLQLDEVSRLGDDVRMVSRICPEDTGEGRRA
jgi:diaminohydroxyphosphoribosylaminopyrimidine deaminase / 5-amino-6-(5-phosphoribosylamino)uracil reductase